MPVPSLEVPFLNIALMITLSPMLARFAWFSSPIDFATSSWLPPLLVRPLSYLSLLLCILALLRKPFLQEVPTNSSSSCRQKLPSCEACASDPLFSFLILNSPYEGLHFYRPSYPLDLIVSGSLVRRKKTSTTSPIQISFSPNNGEPQGPYSWKCEMIWSFS